MLSRQKKINSNSIAYDRMTVEFKKKSMTILTSAMGDRLLKDVFVHLFRLRGIEIRVVKMMRETGWGRVPWVYFEIIETYKRRATFIGKKEFREAFLDYIFRFCFFQIFVKSASGIGQTMLQLGKDKKSRSIDPPKTIRLINGKLEYIPRSIFKQMQSIINRSRSFDY